MVFFSIPIPIEFPVLGFLLSYYTMLKTLSHYCVSQKDYQICLHKENDYQRNFSVQKN